MPDQPMNQAARCPKCRTAFRVQPQLLQTSGGWARCGQCGEVFNALQALVAVAPSPPPPARPAPAGAPASSPWAGPGPAGRAANTSQAQNSRLPPVSSLYRRAEPGPAATLPPRPTPASPAFVPPAKPAFTPRAADLPPTVASTPTPFADVPAAPAAWENSRFPAAAAYGLDDMVAPGIAVQTPSEPPASPSAAAADSAMPSAPVALPEPVATAGASRTPPSFLQAPAPAREPTEVQRTWWSAAVTVLALTALLQAALIARPTLSARYPAMRPLLHPLCVLTRCNAEAAPRHLAALAVESSALSRLSGNDQRYRLSLVLRNRDTQALRWPAIELRLTDAQGVLLVKKVLRVRDLGATVAAIPPGQEQPLQAVLDMGTQPVAGYSVELFYP
ncbi:DUF3426 domain-containing protein [Azohydromonas lata]|uniref:DUF3426 domain-containing protein n=1 Tax=Azohydromonas lata TaxID=45677 RepID=A0ABU5IQM3_9BURK|nr:DUF3426 domain-containing protein [Azohydromonas lata]MDZ5461188.1 DUF3426 domain-containing protein [Azohydromonas lata]